MPNYLSACLQRFLETRNIKSWEYSFDLGCRFITGLDLQTNQIALFFSYVREMKGSSPRALSHGRARPRVNKLTVAVVVQPSQEGKLHYAQAVTGSIEIKFLQHPNRLCTR